MLDDIVVASTTATQEELDHAISEDWRKSPEVKDPPKVEEKTEISEADEAEIAAESETAKPESKTDALKKDAKLESKAEKRIRELKRDREYARQFAEEQTEKNRLLEERLAKLEQGQAKSKEPVATDDPEPQLKDFENQPDAYEKWIKAQGRWEARQEFKALTAKQQKEAEEAEEAEEQQTETQRKDKVFAEYNSRITEAREQFPDWDQVINQTDIPLKEGVRLAIIEMENGPEIAYYLGKHKDEAIAIYDMSTPKAMAEIGRISAKLQKTDSGSPPVKPVSNAAQPIRPVGRSATTSTVNLDTADMETYNRVRDQQQASRNR